MAPRMMVRAMRCAPERRARRRGRRARAHPARARPRAPRARAAPAGARLPTVRCAALTRALWRAARGLAPPARAVAARARAPPMDEGSGGRCPAPPTRRRPGAGDGGCGARFGADVGAPGRPGDPAAAPRASLEPWERTRAATDAPRPPAHARAALRMASLSAAARSMRFARRLQGDPPCPPPRTPPSRCLPSRASPSSDPSHPLFPVRRSPLWHLPWPRPPRPAPST